MLNVLLNVLFRVLSRCFTAVILLELLLTQFCWNDFQVSAAYLQHKGAVYFPLRDGNFETLAWAVKLRNGTKANNVAKDIELHNKGQIGALRDHYLFVHPALNFSFLRRTVFNALKALSENKLNSHLLILDYYQQVTRNHCKREQKIDDPLFKDQWHLVNRVNPLYDINVTGIWKAGITGRGVTVCVVDDGLEWSNPDLKGNYNPDGSWDLNGGDADPSPEGSPEKNSHGTRCAGEIAAGINGVCGIGVAFNANISGLRALDGTITDSLEATAFNKYMQINDIYSCSWGPDDNGRMVEGPQYLAAKAVELGVTEGRNGYGSIYVVASGNGGTSFDNCNYDGYANSVYTLTIGAITEEGKVPFYAEECPAMLAVTFSSGISHNWDIVTTDWTKGEKGSCTHHHTGTSAAAPLAAGMIALMLQARPCLFWRDIHYLVVLTAISAHDANSSTDGWYKNSAGLYHNTFYGFGHLDAWRLVNAAKTWESVPFQTFYTSPMQKPMSRIPFQPSLLSLNYSVSKLIAAEYGLTLLEYVQVSVSVKHPSRGRLMFWLQCPSGTRTLLTGSRPNDNCTDGLKNWKLTTVRCWGEEPHGLWTVIVTDTGLSVGSEGVLEDWQLFLYGTTLSREEFANRRKSVIESYSGKSLNVNSSIPCAHPSGHFPYVQPYSKKVFKILLLVEIFLLGVAIYEIIENMICYGEEKKRTYASHLESDPAPSDHPEDSEIIPLVTLEKPEDEEEM